MEYGIWERESQNSWDRHKDLGTVSGFVWHRNLFLDSFGKYTAQHHGIGSVNAYFVLAWLSIANTVIVDG